jgi:hypothetical protein
MRADAVESVVKTMQFRAEPTHNFHAVIAVLQEFKKSLAWNKDSRRFVSRYRGSPVGFASHCLAEPEHGSGSHYFEKLPLPMPGGQQDTHLATLH